MPFPPVLRKTQGTVKVKKPVIPTEIGWDHPNCKQLNEQICSSRAKEQRSKCPPEPQEAARDHVSRPIIRK